MHLFQRSRKSCVQPDQQWHFLQGNFGKPAQKWDWNCMKFWGHFEPKLNWNRSFKLSGEVTVRVVRHYEHTTLEFQTMQWIDSSTVGFWVPLWTFWYGGIVKIVKRKYCNLHLYQFYFTTNKGTNTENNSLFHQTGQLHTCVFRSFSKFTIWVWHSHKVCLHGSN